MGSKKPTPVSRAPAPVPSSARRSEIVVSAVLRSISAVRLIGSIIVLDPRLHRRGVLLEALGPGDRGARPREVAGPVTDPHLGEPAAEHRRWQRRAEPSRPRGRAHVGWAAGC